jgi:hypothetical protein
MGCLRDELVVGWGVREDACCDRNTYLPLPLVLLGNRWVYQPKSVYGSHGWAMSACNLISAPLFLFADVE